jgi:hypothetical protein
MNALTPQQSSPSKMGRGTGRRPVEGQRAQLADFVGGPSTMLRMVPLPTLRAGRNK